MSEQDENPTVQQSAVWPWLRARLSERQSQVAIAALMSGISTALASSGAIPVWAAPLLPLTTHALQAVLTPDALPPVQPAQNP